MTTHGACLPCLAALTARGGGPSAGQSFRRTAGGGLAAVHRRNSSRMTAGMHSRDRLANMMVGQPWSAIVGTTEHPTISWSAADRWTPASSDIEPVFDCVNGATGRAPYSKGIA